MHRSLMASPVRPGKTDHDVLRVAKLFEERSAEYQESRRTAGITLERCYLQHTATGDLVLGYSESNAPPADAFQTLASSQLEIDQEFLRYLSDVLGITTGSANNGTSPETIAEWNDPEITARHSGLAFYLPVAPGRENAARALAHEAYVIRRNELTESRRGFGQSLEVLSLQPTADGYGLGLYIESPDPVQANQRFAASHSSFDRWFKSQLSGIVAEEIDLTLPVAGVEELFDSEGLAVAG